MLNTRKLVYILPEVCYVAELLPTKKPHTFSIQSFRQINAQFMEDEELIIENVQKLFRKLEPETYTIILPDFLFTNTIIDVAETSETGVRQYLLEKLLPSLGLSKDTHQLETFILTQHKGKTKVQLSGLEKSVLGPLFPVAEERGITIDAICPFSWTLKSVISLEPSLSAVELGKHLYLAQHYIGVEQSTFFPTDELSNVVDTVRTLRGAEPNLQTLYLLTSTETGEEIKAKLKQRIPLQQLAEDEVSMDGLPAHLKTAIEAAAKTLDIEDFPVPRFKLEKYVAEEKSVPAVAPVEEEEELPAPTQNEAALKQPSIEIFEESLGDDEDDVLPPLAAPALPGAATPLTVTTTTSTLVEVEEVEADEDSKADDHLELKGVAFEEDEEVGEPTPEFGEAPTQFVDRGKEELNEIEEESDLNNEELANVEKPHANTDWLDDAVEDLAAPKEEEGFDEPEERVMPAAVPARTMPAMRESQPVRERPVIKNRNSTSSMVRMIGISIAALIITVLVGVGAGFALLKNSENGSVSPAVTASPKASPVVAQASPTPAATASANASASASLAKDKVKVLVVNATGVSGKAGGVKTKLTTAGYKTVDTGNAAGTYQKGNFLLMTNQDATFLSQIQKDTGLTVSFGTAKPTAEDAAGKYDVIFVVNE